jgi:hypothetical protein
VISKPHDIGSRAPIGKYIAHVPPILADEILYGKSANNAFSVNILSILAARGE